jgi:hypothetical protein
VLCGIPNYDQAYGENRMFSMPCGIADCKDCHGDHPEAVPGEDYQRCDVNDICRNAIILARSARFEFGEGSRP